MRGTVNFLIFGWLISAMYGEMIAKHNPNDTPPTILEVQSRATMLANLRNKNPANESILANIIVFFRPRYSHKTPLVIVPAKAPNWYTLAEK